MREESMIELKIESDLFQKQLTEIIIEGQEISTKKIRDLESFERTSNKWEKKAIDFLVTNIKNIPEEFISRVRYLREENLMHFQIARRDIKKKPEEYMEYLSEHLCRKINAFKITADYLSISEIIAGNERPELNTVEDKIFFVLQKLYQLYNDNFYSISLIFDINEIEYRDSEPIEIAENLKTRGYGIMESKWSSSDLMKISVKGATYIERKNKSLKNKSKSAQDSDLNKKIDLVILKLEEMGYGQEIIFDEIEELRALSKKLSKKTLSQLIKGKMLDLVLSELISKDTASFIYESLLEGKFNLLK